MCSVAWCSFSWEAFATLTTGLLAVGGAIVIAKLQMHILTRQTEIADRQTDIAAGQAELERVKLRSVRKSLTLHEHGFTHSTLTGIFLLTNATPTSGKP